jgi:hypothetical protein
MTLRAHQIDTAEDYPMFRNYRTLVSALLVIVLAAAGVYAQKSKKNKTDNRRSVLWERLNIPNQDLLTGPGGESMRPDLRRVEFIRDEKGGHSVKYRIKDAAGRTWVAKTGNEAQSETAAVRLLSGIGYKTEINYLVPTITIPGRGTFTNVRLEARPDNVERGDAWKWGNTPFENTPQMRGLILMMAFINNWDMKSTNNVILETAGRKNYVISDLGVSFGKTGGNSLPLFWRIGRSRNRPDHYAKARFVKGVKGERVRLVFNGKHRSLMSRITPADARWLADLLGQLSERQIRDAFRAANYSEANIRTLTTAVRSRIRQLDTAGRDQRLAVDNR